MCHTLVQQGMRPSTAESLGNDLRKRLRSDAPQSHEAISQALQQETAKRIRVSGPLLSGDGDRAIALMLGPSGAGKTSVITKLAAHYRLEEKKSVAIVTFDTYREASVEQLRMYAHVLGVPFASALSPRQVYEGLRRYAQTDLVLIDMPGIGPDDVSSAKELHHLLREESEVATHLVLAASTREQDLRRIVERVKDLPLLRLLFTKLDETDSFGTIFELAHQTGAPLSYWSAGQRVPEDIELATPERLATFLIAQRYVVAHTPVGQPFTLPQVSHVQEPVGALAEQNER
jgi:flagellar biosynthesis protein FlhF